MKRMTVAAIVILMLLSGCRAQIVQTERVSVAAGIVPIAAFVERVAGGHADVITMIPPGHSPANYEPTAKQMQALSDADVYFTLEMPTEQAGILPKMSSFAPDVQIVNLRSAAAEAYPLLSAGDGSVDPHLWLSPKRAAVMVAQIAQTLAGLDGAHAQDYRNNADELIAQIEAADREIRQTLTALDTKDFMIYHGSYTYFAHDYGLNMISIEKAGKQATAAEIAAVIDTARAHGIKTVFHQQEFDDAQAQTIADEIGGSVRSAAPLSPDYTQALLDFADALAASGG